MVESVGRKLNRARQERKIPIEYAAKATRIRADRLVDLENDDYTNFPNLAYAKGFLVIYAKYLNVDISDFIRAFDTGNPVTIADYEYLSNPPDPLPRATRSFSGGGAQEQPRGPSVGGILFILLLLAVCGVAMMYFYVVAQRIGIVTPATTSVPQLAPEPAASGVEQSGTAAEVVSTAPEPTPTPAPPPTAGVPDVTPEPEMPTVLRAEPVQGTTPVPEAGTADTPATSSNIEVRPLSKAWVTIRQGGPEQAPIFEDFLYPNAQPLRFSGTGFHIQVREENAVEIRVNGEVVPYQAPGVTVQ